ncbi:MAG: hypothetical protein ACREJX_17330, partial [Polyangiaceae bacterium]
DVKPGALATDKHARAFWECGKLVFIFNGLRPSFRCDPRHSDTRPRSIARAMRPRSQPLRFGERLAIKARTSRESRRRST